MIFLHLIILLSLHMKVFCI